MDISNVVHVFELGISLIVLLVLCFNLWPSHRLDSFRQSIFAVRDDLFDYAAAGHIGFDDPAYKLLRKSMNGLIRYGHNLTFFRFACTAIFFKFMGTGEYDWSSKWTAALENVPDEVRNQLSEYHAKAMQLALNRMVNGSPILLASVLVLLIVRSAHRQWIGIREAFTNSTSKIIDARIIEEEAAKAA